MIDRSLNYGRHLIEEFCIQSIPYSNVLDIGAGFGDDLMIANKINPDCRMHALEYYPSNIINLEEKEIQVSSIDLEKETFPYDNNNFDIVIANQILEHTKEIFWIFHEISRILKPGGKLIVGVPNLASMHNRLLLLFGHQPSPIKSASAHVRGFTKRDLIQFINLCWPDGYNLIKWSGSNFYPFPPFISKPLARIFPSCAWGLFMLLKKEREYSNEFIQFPSNENLETNYFVGDNNN